MNFIFISPNFPKTYYLFCSALKQNGIITLGLAEDSYDSLSAECKASLDDYIQVSSLENYDEVFKAVAFYSYKYGKIDWIESNNEYWLEQDAKLRTDFNITTGVQTDHIRPYKYKSAMKEFYQKAGVKTARYHIVTTLPEAFEFINEVGYPVIVKPDNGVGASTTYRLSTKEAVIKFYKRLPTTRFIMEEYINGSIISYDGICDSNSNIIYDTAHQFPNSIMDVVNEKQELFYYSMKNVPADLKEIGQRVIKSFNVKSRFFHCEYFRLLEDKEGLGKKGSLVALEVNMRPPGGYTPDMMNFASDINVYQIWANMVAFNEGRFDVDNRPYVAVYYARRDGVPHQLTHQQICLLYSKQLCMVERMPAIFTDTMGNQMYTARFETEKQAKKFINACAK